MTGLFALLFALAGCWIGRQLYASSGGPTAQAVAMGMGLAVVVVGAVTGALLGRAVGNARKRGERRRAWILAVVGLILAAVPCYRAYAGRQHADALAAIRAEALTPGRARELMAGAPDVVTALAYNRSCPADVLAELAKSGDYGVRANVAANPSTPAAVVDALAKDESEIVRLYASYNPARPK